MPPEEQQPIQVSNDPAAVQPPPTATVPTPAELQPQTLAQTASTTQPAAPDTVTNQVKPRNKKKLILLVVGLPILLIITFLSLVYFNMINTKKAGLNAANSYMETLKTGNSAGARAALQPIISRFGTDSKGASQETSLAAQTGFVSSEVQANGYKLAKTRFGTDAARNKMVTAVYEITVQGAPEYYTVGVVKKNGKWVVDNVGLSQTKPN